MGPMATLRLEPLNIPAACSAAVSRDGDVPGKRFLPLRMCARTVVRPHRRSFRQAVRIRRHTARGGLVQTRAASEQGVPQVEVAANEPELQDTRDDRVLPDSLDDAVFQAAAAAARVVSAGGSRALVELLIPELENLQENGAQERAWNCARQFVQAFQETARVERVRAIVPDAGAAAMLTHMWGGITFNISSLNDLEPVQDDDEAVVIISPDHTSLTAVERVADALAAEELQRPFLLWNHRLISGDVGVGYNVRRLRDGLLASFEVAYSLQPTPAGSVLRSFPEPWKVFLDDPDVPGRYLLAAAVNGRPSPDYLDALVMGKAAADEGRDELTAAEKATGIFASLNRFMKSLAN